MKRVTGSLLIAVLLGFLWLPTGVFAHESEEEHPHELANPAAYTANGIRLDDYFTEHSWQWVAVVSVILIIVTAVSLMKGFMSEAFRKTAFLLMVVPVIGVTVFLAGSTIYLNHISSSGGPVHWHADFLLYQCGEPIDLKNPTGLSNRIGTPVLHEHGDNRIHVEGVVLEPSHVDLKNFFHVIGGTMTKNTLIIPTDDGPRIVKNGDQCSDGRAGEWQVFVYQTNEADGTVTQQKLEDFPDYILSPYGVVPPADCLVFEFTPEQKTRTDKICNFYQIELNKGNMKLK